MRLTLIASVLLAAVNVDAFAPVNTGRSVTSLQSTVEATDFNSKLEASLAKMAARDAESKISADDLKVVFEDEHIVVVDKPAGVLCVPNKDNNPSLSQAVFDKFGSESGRADKMVVHRLGMDTSGLVVFARTEDALRGMNTAFRTRSVTRTYEALACGSIEEAEGTINLPLMRDYEFPPYMRVSTDEHQKALIGLSVEDVGKKLLERPKESLTKFTVVGKEELEGNAVTRVSLTSISGRTHQLNVHLAAYGHPIVGDQVYGINGEAAANGGLEAGTSASSASADLQESIASAAKSMCVHAKTISFEHPVTEEKLSFESAAPF
ncbi:psedouridylate synthase [Chaetoceros tenuissimus]|uniref:Psedouridylate synthase n=1 Tax=Chaetoceros tenuissimus TaxID=426638 RepID=A0AAD3CMU9_9STRA|nr:psedouridylate synthase [Chaetoceros tenuissimus]